ncbi:MAG: amino acid adenylation domain-containing protein [Bacilli bacterium]|nr:amino acid adenylation domain-containing protein [Bacilli bacterium]
MLINLIIEDAKRFSNEIAAVGNDEKITYEAMIIRAQKIASKLNKSGIQKGDFLTIELPKSIDYVCSMIASWMVGGAFAALDALYPQDRLDFIAADCKAKVRINKDFLLDVDKEECFTNYPEMDRLDPALLIYTSGSTGRPKGVLHSQQSIFDSMLRSKKVLEDYHLDIPGYRYLESVPLSFVAGIQVVLASLQCGLTLYLVDTSIVRDPAKLSDYIYENQLNIGYIPPKLLKVFKPKGNSLKLVFVGSEKVTNLFSKDFHIVNSYGSSESAGGVLFFFINKEYENTPVGVPVCNEKVYLIDEKGNRADEGEICLSGNFALEYINLEEQSKNTFVPNPYKEEDGYDFLLKTGDIGRRLPTGNILYVNRKDWLIKINGQRVEPGEIEETVRLIPEILDCAVKDFAGNAGQTFICAYYVLREGKEISEEEISKFLTTKLPPYMVPAFYQKLDKLPVNTNGKLNRLALPAIDLSSTMAPYKAPTNPIEEELCKGFEKVLNVEKVGINDDFFYLGGDSIRVMALQQLLPNLGLNTKIIYENRTVEKIAQILKDNLNKYEKATLDGVYPLTQAQLGIFFACIKNEGKAVYNNPMLLRFPSSTNEKKLAEAIDKAVRAHPGLLATMLIDEAGNPMTKYNPEFAKDPICPIETLTQEEFEKEKVNLQQPFFIKKDRLFRFKIIKTEKNFYLFMDIHHIVFDGFSMKVIVRDILDAYEGKAIAKEKFTAFDESIREKKDRGSNAYEEAKDWYLKEFGDVDEVSLPEGDLKETETKFGQKKISLNVKFEELRKFCEERKTTENVVTLTAFGLLLSSYTMNKKGAFATVYNGRHDLTTARTVSMFVRTLPVLCVSNPLCSVDVYLKKIKEQLMGAMVNDLYSFAELTNSTGYTSDVLFTWQGDLFSIPSFKEGDINLEELPFNATGEKLSIQIYPKNGQIELNLQYHSNLYSDEWIKRFASRYEQVLRNLLEKETIAEVSLVSKEETKDLIALSYGGDLPYNNKLTFIDLFAKQVELHPAKIAVVDKNSEYVYANLDEISNKVAHYLVKHNVQKKEFVAIKMHRVKEFFAAVIGTQKAGAAYVPIDPAYPEDRISYMISDCQAKVVLTEELIAKILVEEKDASPINLAEIDNPAYMIYTSGSTGKPKGVVILHHSLTALIAWYKHGFELTENTKHVAHASFSFDASVIDIFPTLTSGGEVHVLDEELRMDLDLIKEYLDKNKITGMNSSTAIGMSLINAHPDLCLEYILMGGEKMVPCKKVSCKLVNAYGPTEFTVASSYHIVDQEKEKDIPIGRAVPNTYSFICDVNGCLLPQGMAGELCLSGIQIAAGYYNREELTEERFVPCSFLPGQKMYRTGDLARYNKEGELEYMGRIDFQVKLRGFRIELGEIENCACLYDGIKQAAAEVKKGHLILYYTAEKPIDESALKAKMGESLTEYMVPNVFVCLEEMPMTPNGKINRKALPEPNLGTLEIVAPRNDDEQKAFDCLAGILGYKEFGVTTNFEVAGLTSLGSMQFTAQLSTLFNTSVRVNDLEKYPTIETLVRFITNKEEEKIFALQADYPLTMAQKGILTEVLAHPDTTIYNIPLWIELPDEIDLGKLQEAIVKAIDAHPYLKMKLITDSQGNIRAYRQDDAEVVISVLEDEGKKIDDYVTPFDLFKDNLYRFYLIKSDKGNKLFFDAHHIAFDGESLTVLLDDIDKAYRGEVLEKEVFSEFEVALDEEARHQGEILEEAKSWYRNLLEGRDIDCLPVFDTNLKEAGKGEFNIEVKLDKAPLEAFLRETKTTVNSLWISALGLGIAKFLNRKDAIFTTVYNGRNDAKMAKSVGMFVHTLPVALDPFATGSAAEYVKATATQIKKSMANDIYGFMEIAHDLEVRADILFVYEGRLGTSWSIDGHKVKEMNVISGNQNKSAILVAITETDEGFVVHTEYDGHKYEEWSLASLINSMILSFKALVNKENPSEISLLNKEMKEELDKFNLTQTDVERTTLVSLFKEKVKQFPERTAAIYDESKLTYKELDKQSNKLAAYLSSKGIGKGKVVSIMISRSLNMTVCPLGVMKTGAAYQPLDPSYPEERLEFMIKDADASLIIADRNLINKIPNNTRPVLFTDEFEKLKESNKDFAGPEPDDLMILLYTSGTTGVPKGVMLCQFNLVNFCAWYRKAYNLTENCAVSAYAGFGFDACMMDLYPALTTGAAVCIVPEDMRMNLAQLKEYFGKHNVTHSFMTTQVGRLFAEENDTCYSLQQLSVGGEKLAPVTRIPSGYKFFNGYGPTECTIFSTIQLYDKPYDRIPIGHALDNYKLYVVDTNLKEVPVGCLGELLISGYGVGLGYLNQIEKTRTTFIPNPFSKEKGYERAYRTGDIVRRLPNGAIDFIGRNDGQVKIRGFRIELTEVEMVIREYPDVKDCTVQAFKDENSGGMYLAAYVVSDKYINIDKLKDFIKERKPPYMVPPSIMQLEAIPLNQNQKVNKRALPKPTFVDDQKDYVAPSTPLEKDIAEIYHEILGVEKVSATDSFFDIGGTSLTAARVVMHALNKGYSIAYKDVFDNPSPRQLAALITSRAGQQEVKQETAPQEEASSDLKSLQFNDVKYVEEIKSERELGTVLLTGSTGFLGVHILKELLNNKIKTLALVRGNNKDPLVRLKGMLMYYFDSPLDEEVEKYVTVVDGDITDKGLAEKLKDYKFDTIINSAACVKHFAKDDIIERINIHGVENLIEIAKAKKVRLVQVSTLSVAGENVDHKFPSNYLMKENQLFFGQDLSNKYAYSKFKAEEAILKAIDEGTLDGKIIRVGNLMSRQSDGEFQINSITNSFMKTLKGYRVLSKFPVTNLDTKIDFSPIDETAKTILILAKTPSKFTVFHSMNSHQVQMGDVIDAMNLAGIKIDKVSRQEFGLAVQEAMKDEEKSAKIASLFSYASGDNHSYEFIQNDITFTVKALYILGYRWPITDFNYLIKAIDSLETLGFFDREDI